jgi:hypothetical protein
MGEFLSGKKSAGGIIARAAEKKLIFEAVKVCFDVNKALE